MNTHDPKLQAAMRDLTRKHMADIWRRGKLGEPLDAEAQAFYDAMRMHPEYDEVWENAEQFTHEELLIKDVNPFLHISLHAVIERQILSGDPPETQQTVFRLTHRGMDRHDALHRIAIVLGESIAEVTRGKPFDQQAYKRHLRALKY